MINIKKTPKDEDIDLILCINGALSTIIQLDQILEHLEDTV